MSAIDRSIRQLMHSQINRTAGHKTKLYGFNGICWHLIVPEVFYQVEVEFIGTLFVTHP